MNKRSVIIYTIFFLSNLALIFQSCSSDETVSPSNAVEYSQIDFDAAWSKSGTMIAFVHNDLDPELTGIYVMNASGTDKRMIRQGNATGPDWSAQDSAIVYEFSGDLFIYDLLNDKTRMLATGTSSRTPKWNPVSGKIAYIANSDLCTIEPDGTGKVTIGSSCDWPDWSRDGRYLYYFKPSHTSGGIKTGDTLFRYDTVIGLSSIVNALSAQSYLSNTHLSIADDKVYYSSTFSDASAHIYEYRFATMYVAQTISSLSYAPDFDVISGSIVYTNRTRGEGRLWIRDANGEERRINY
jgi:hypothetical protein